MRRRARAARAKILLLGLALAACSGTASEESGDAGTALVRTTAGDLEGEELPSGVLAFRGVPYARPPVGDRRWRPPEPPESWQGVRDAKTFAPACPQGDGTAAYYRRAARRLGRDTTAVPDRGPTSEDCLHLNVWTPGTSAERALPVFVWVHGGAGNTGSGSDPLFRGNRLARRGAVVVTLDYRLGPLGFLAHPALSAEAPSGSSGNYALRDLVRALRWIRANADAFGGDPARVTLAGQSSGASLVETLLVVPPARGLFHRAVSHSATLLDPPPLRAAGEEPDAEAGGVRFLERLGFGADVRPATLRSIPVDSLLAAAARAGPSAPTAPVVDGRLLPGDPADLWATGEFARIPILKGTTDDEFSLFMPPTPVEPGEYEEWADERYGALGSLVLEARPPGPDAETTRRRRVRVLSDQTFRVPALLVLRWTDGRSPVHLYRFGWRPDDGAVGAFHSADLPFLFDTHEAAGWWRRDTSITRLTSIVQDAWLDFAATGSPGAEGLPPWPASKPDRPRVMVLDEPPRMETMEPLELVRTLADRLEARPPDPGGRSSSMDEARSRRH